MKRGGGWNFHGGFQVWTGSVDDCDDVLGVWRILMMEIFRSGLVLTILMVVVLIFSSGPVMMMIPMMVFIWGLGWVSNDGDFQVWT